MSIAFNQVSNYLGHDSESGIRATQLIAGVNFDHRTEVNCAVKFFTSQPLFITCATTRPA